MSINFFRIMLECELNQPTKNIKSHTKTCKFCCDCHRSSPVISKRFYNWSAFLIITYQCCCPESWDKLFPRWLNRFLQEVSKWRWTRSLIGPKLSTLRRLTLQDNLSTIQDLWWGCPRKSSVNLARKRREIASRWIMWKITFSHLQSTLLSWGSFSDLLYFMKLFR